jgi:hypothetical protein
MFKSEGRLWRWNVQQWICQINIEGEPASADSAAVEPFLEIQSKVIEGDAYTDEQLYSCDETALYYRLFPNKSLNLKRAPNKAGMETQKERDLVAVFQ